MRAYDKELTINGRVVRSPEQQVYKNMKDIEELKNIIVLEEEYACTIDLATSATTVAKSYTNAGEEVKSGWLIDPHANKFKITGGDDSNLLIEFYASYRGPAGASGASAIDDTGTASDKVWSSQKTNTEITNAKDKGIFYITTSPSLVNDHYTIDYDDLKNITNVNQLKAYDLIIYINSGVPTAIYKVTSLVDLPTIILEPVGTYAQGEKEYIHNIFMYVTGTNGGGFYCFSFKNTVSSAYTSSTDIITAMNALGIVNTGDYFGGGVPCSGECNISGTRHKTISMATNTEGTKFEVDTVNNGSPVLRGIPGSNDSEAKIDYIKDIVI